MAPPRQRPATNLLDDSRSEASSGAREARTSGPGKSRKTTAAHQTATAATASSRDMKVAAAAAAVSSLSMVTTTTGPDAEGHDSDLPGIPWTQMPLSILHDYRHAYKLSTPSAYARSYSQMLLSSGIGLRSPTAIAARRDRARVRRETRRDDASSSDPERASESYHQQQQRHDDGKVLHGIIAQGRVGKDVLALTVRKHFNGVGLAEQDAIARFLYKVREEGKGREFRLRFQPQS